MKPVSATEKKDGGVLEQHPMDKQIREASDRANGWFDRSVFIVFPSKLKPALEFGRLFGAEEARKPEYRVNIFSRSYARDRVDTWAKMDLPSDSDPSSNFEAVVSLSSAAPSYGRMSNYRQVMNGISSSDAIVFCVGPDTFEAQLSANLDRIQRTIMGMSKKEEGEEEKEVISKPVMLAYLDNDEDKVKDQKRDKTKDMEAKKLFAEQKGMSFFDYSNADQATVRDQIASLLSTPKDKFLPLPSTPPPQAVRDMAKLRPRGGKAKRIKTKETPTIPKEASDLADTKTTALPGPTIAIPDDSAVTVA